MTRFYPFLAIGLLAVALAACNQQKSASEANRDTAQAQQDANKDVAEASKKASGQVDDAQQKLDAAQAKAAADVATANAKAGGKINDATTDATKAELQFYKTIFYECPERDESLRFVL